MQESGMAAVPTSVAPLTMNSVQDCSYRFFGA
jgi:hypothetical protein